MTIDKIQPPSHFLDRRQILVGLGAVAATTVLPKAWAAGLSQPIPPGPVASISAWISPNDSPLATIGPQFCGLSYEKSTMSSKWWVPENTPLINLFNLLGKANNLLRIGGNSVAGTIWTPNGGWAQANQVSEVDIHNLHGFMQATNWTVLYAVRLVMNPGSADVSAAVSEASYVASALGGHLYGLEIGNEPDKAYSSYSAYLADWTLIANAIKAALPDVRLTGPAVAGNTTWVQEFATSEGTNVSLLTDHYYRGNGKPKPPTPAPTPADLVTYPDTQLETVMAALSAATKSYGVPARLAETNSYYNGGATGTSDAFASALWSLDHLFTVAISGGSGVNFHGSVNGVYSPIPFDGVNVQSIAPLYYGLLLFCLAGQGTVLRSQISAGGLNLSIYSIQRPSGGQSIIVINKDTTENIALTLDCGTTVQAATLQCLQSPGGLASTSGQTLQGAEVNIDGSFSPGTPYSLTTQGYNVACYVPCSTAVLILAN